LKKLYWGSKPEKQANSPEKNGSPFVVLKGNNKKKDITESRKWMLKKLFLYVL
jgi:hypothetical protein